MAANARHSTLAAPLALLLLLPCACVRFGFSGGNDLRSGEQAGTNDLAAPAETIASDGAASDAHREASTIAADGKVPFDHKLLDIKPPADKPPLQSTGAVIRMGSFSKSTSVGIQAVAHSLGVVPKALILWTNGNANSTVSPDQHLAIGFSDGIASYSLAGASQDAVSLTAASRRMAPAVLTIIRWSEMVVAEAILQQWTSSSFSLYWTKNDANPYVIHYLLIGGAAVSAKALVWAMPAGLGLRPVTGVGFKPSVVMHLHGGLSLTTPPPIDFRGSSHGIGVMDAAGNQWALQSVAFDLRSQTESMHIQSTTACIQAMDSGPILIKSASIASMDADGFTLNFNYVTDPQAGYVASLALAGLNARAGNFAKSTAAAPAIQTVAGVPFTPKALVLAGVQDAAKSTPAISARLGLGAATTSAQGSVAYQDTSGLSLSAVDGVDRVNQIFVKMNNPAGAIEAAATLLGLAGGGFFLQWSPNDSIPTQILYLALD